MAKLQKEIVAVYASDWGAYCAQISREHEFELVRGFVIGELIAEDEQKIVIAHHAFDGGELRHTTTVPKVNVIGRWDFFIDEEQPWPG